MVEIQAVKKLLCTKAQVLGSARLLAFAIRDYIDFAPMVVVADRIEIIQEVDFGFGVERVELGLIEVREVDTFAGVISFLAASADKVTWPAVQFYWDLLIDVYEWVNRQRDLGSGEPSAPALTGRQVQILQLSGEGLTDGQIAARLGISASTVRVHAAKAKEKLGAATRGVALMRAAALGVINISKQTDR